MFRHSEIQTILKERRHRLENADSDDEIEELGASHPQSEQAADSSSDRPKISPVRDVDPPTKRKWTEFVQPSEENPENLTHRRLARELDEVPTSSVDLLYGEEESSAVAPDKTHTLSKNSLGGRNKVSYGSSSPPCATDAPFSNNTPIMPKFNWPSLGEANT